jgi:hypothetical protein
MQRVVLLMFILSLLGGPAVDGICGTPPWMTGPKGTLKVPVISAMLFTTAVVFLLRWDMIRWGRSTVLPTG